MALLKDIDDLDTNGQKGDWCFASGAEYLFLRYGGTLEDTCTVRISRVGDASHWEWDGDGVAPTLSPSIRVTGKNGKELWHGYLRAGKIETA